MARPRAGAGTGARSAGRHWPIWGSRWLTGSAAARRGSGLARSACCRSPPRWPVTRVGSLARRRSIIGTEAIIGWRIHQSWFQRRQGLVTLTATTAAGRQHYAVQDVPVAQALAVAAAATGDLIRPFLIAGQD